MPSDDSKPDRDPSQPQGAEKRQHERVDFHRPVKVVVPDEQTAIDVVATNVSRGGIFLRASPPLPEGKKVSLDIDTDRGQVTVDEGEVKWVKKFEPIDLDGMPPGMGVQFKKMSPEAERTIGDLIDEVIGQGADQAPPPVDVAAAAGEPAGGPVASPAQPIELPPDPEPIVPQAKVDPTWPPRASMKIPTQPKAAPAQPAAPEPASAPAAARDIEENMAAFTKPPPPRTRMLIFVGFVLLVAVLTFLTLMWLKPFDEVAGQRTPPVAAKSAPVEHKAPPVGDEAPPTEDKAPPTEDKTPPTEEKAPPTEDQAPPVEDRAPPAEEKAPPAADEARSAAAGPPILKSPTFHQAGQGWRMSIEAGGAVAFKTFTLKAPPRLVVDVKGAVWNGPGQLTAPAPFVSRIRFGKQPGDTVRLVLDFESGQIPEYAVTEGEDRLTIRFP